MDATSPLFITRRRKKWKFAHFSEWPNCFEADEVAHRQWKQPTIVELGAGTADLSVGLAKRRPYETFVAVDVKADRLYTGAKIALEQKLDAITFVRAHAQQLRAVFADHSLAALWITFPDPFPRKRQAKHRLTHPVFLNTYRSLLVSGGVVNFKTDDQQLFLWSLEQIVTTGWRIKELSFDLHQSNLADEYKITTRYERKFIAENKPIYYVSFAWPSGREDYAASGVGALSR